MTDYNGPPIRFNKGFLDDKDNYYRLSEIILGITTAFLNSYCFPNDTWLQQCVYRIHSFSQIFSVICVNVFFVLITLILAFCSLFGIMDSYYKFNFPVLEKMLTSLAALMYAISSLLIIVDLITTEFYFWWLTPLIFSAWTFAIYIWDASRRWKESGRF